MKYFKLAIKRLMILMGETISNSILESFGVIVRIGRAWRYTRPGSKSSQNERGNSFVCQHNWTIDDKGCIWNTLTICFYQSRSRNAVWGDDAWSGLKEFSLSFLWVLNGVGKKKTIWLTLVDNAWTEFVWIQKAGEFTQTHIFVLFGIVLNVFWDKEIAWTRIHDW